MSLSDARRMYVLLRDAGAEGCHSHELRRRGISGNPSQRAKDIVSHGVAIWTARENVGKRPGSRYWLEGFQPSDAVRVVPNFRREAQEPPAQRDAASAHAPGDSAALNITPASEQVAIREPVAIVRDGDSFAEVPIDARPCRRCEGTGQLVGGECPACFGTGVIARTRVNSYVQAEAA